MAHKREIRDPIHGFVERTETVEKLIDTSVFQRLRNIRQLAMANLVYPGAIHTRFEHSIGTMYIAEKLARQLFGEDDTEEEKRKKVRYAALLHDIGHGPFSHVSESVLKSTIKSKTGNIEEIHEEITCKIIECNPEISKLLSQYERENIIGLLRGEGGDKVEKQIVSSPLDADKQDYLLRDSYFCGVKYGVFDLDRLINELRTVEDQGENILVASQDGMYAVEQFVIAKYHMHRQVYGHRIRLITDSMIVRALKLGINEDNLQFLKDLYEYEDSSDYINNYLKWNDIRLTSEILNEEYKGKYAHDIFKRLTERRLLKRIFRKNIESIEANERFFLIEWIKEKNEQKDTYMRFKENLESKVAKYLSGFFKDEIDKNYVISNIYAMKSLKKKPKKDDEKIKILDGSRIENIEDISTLLRSIDSSLEDRFIDVYAPIVYSDETDKKRKLTQFEKDIEPIVVETVNEIIKEIEGDNHDPRKNDPANH